MVDCRIVCLDLQKKRKSNIAASFTPRPSEKSANPTTFTSQRLFIVVVTFFFVRHLHRSRYITFVRHITSVNLHYICTSPLHLLISITCVFRGESANWVQAQFGEKWGVFFFKLIRNLWISNNGKTIEKLKLVQVDFQKQWVKNGNN